MSNPPETRITQSFPDSMLKEIDAFKRAEGITTRAEAIRRLARAALDLWRKEKGREHDLS